MDSIPATQDLLRVIWARDPDLQSWVPATNDDTNRLFEEGVNIPGVPMPYAVISDSGVQSTSNVGDCTFFEKRAFAVRIYANDRTQLNNLARRFRLVFSNLPKLATEDGQICGARISGGRMIHFPDGTRQANYVLNVYSAENLGPSRLRSTTQER